MTADGVVERVFREEYGRVFAGLARTFRDFDLVEDGIQDALVTALAKWKEVPPNPAGWITTTARRKILDRLRRGTTFRRLLPELAPEPQELDVDFADSALTDERLELIFTCCHPALAIDAQVALTLKTIAGLDTDEIARALLTSTPTMYQRLVRAKRKIRDAGIPYRTPDDHELPDRLAGVLAVVYLVFNEGYAATKGDSQIREELTEEAIRLGRLLVDLMPDEPEALGLLALMLLHDSRRPSRRDAAGMLVTLEDQDRSLWDERRIIEGRHLVERSLRMGMPGPYQLQAAISAVHSEAASYADTDWEQIVHLYGELARIQPTPVVAMNRALAVGFAGHPDRGLDQLVALEPDLGDDHRWHAARADLLRRLGEHDEAARALGVAIDLATNEAERRHLERRLSQIDS